jgi:hypothetical protein
MSLFLEGLDIFLFSSMYYAVTTSIWGVEGGIGFPHIGLADNKAQVLNEVFNASHIPTETSC